MCGCPGKPAHAPLAGRAVCLAAHSGAKLWWSSQGGRRSWVKAHLCGKGPSVQPQKGLPVAGRKGGPQRAAGPPDPAARHGAPGGAARHTHTVYPGGHKSTGPPWSHKGGRAPCALAPVVRSVAGIKDIAAARTGRQGALGDGDRATRAPQSTVRIPPRLPIRVPSAPRRQLFPRAPLPSNPDPPVVSRPWPWHAPRFTFPPRGLFLQGARPSAAVRLWGCGGLGRCVSLWGLLRAPLCAPSPMQARCLLRVTLHIHGFVPRLVLHNHLPVRRDGRRQQ